MGRFQKGQSGNPKGRPKKRRPNVSAFDIVFDKRLAVNQNGEEHEMTVDEALELKTYQDALKGSRMAIRQVLKMIERREKALAKQSPSESFKPLTIEHLNDPRNADEAMLILGIAERQERPVPEVYGQPLLLATWATQAAISRPGRQMLDDYDVKSVERCTVASETLNWPRGAKR